MMIMQKKSEKNVFKFSFRSKNEMILSIGGRCLSLFRRVYWNHQQEWRNRLTKAAMDFSEVSVPANFLRAAAVLSMTAGGNTPRDS